MQRLSFLRRLAGPVLAASLAGSSLFLTSTPAAAQSKIAVIDLRRAIYETEEGLRVQASLRKLFDSRRGELEAKGRQLQSDKDALDKELAQGKTPKEQLQKKADLLQKNFADFQLASRDAEIEMQRKEGELTQPILNKILEIVGRIASTEGYEMIVDKSVVPYFRRDLEVTDRAIQMYNSGQGAAPAAPATPDKNKPATPPAPAPAPKPVAPPPAAPPAKK